MKNSYMANSLRETAADSDLYNQTMGQFTMEVDSPLRYGKG